MVVNVGSWQTAMHDISPLVWNTVLQNQVFICMIARPMTQYLSPMAVPVLNLALMALNAFQWTHAFPILNNALAGS